MEEANGDVVEIWPDNLATVNVFTAMSTQWRVSMGGPTGLDYSALPTVMKFMGIPGKHRSDVFEGVRVMEDAALVQMRLEQ